MRSWCQSWPSGLNFCTVIKTDYCHKERFGRAKRSLLQIGPKSPHPIRLWPSANAPYTFLKNFGLETRYLLFPFGHQDFPKLKHFTVKFKQWFVWHCHCSGSTKEILHLKLLSLFKQASFTFDRWQTFWRKYKRKCAPNRLQLFLLSIGDRLKNCQVHADLGKHDW